jgi:hypothetical protein
VLREHASKDVLVKLDAEGMGDLLGDAYAAEPWITTLQFDIFVIFYYDIFEQSRQIISELGRFQTTPVYRRPMKRVS